MNKILAVDLGNWNTKTPKDVIFESRYSTVKDENNIGENIIKFDGKEFFMEKGTFDKEYNKANKDYMPNLLYAIASSYPDLKNFEIDLALGLPLAQLKEKDKLKRELENKTFEFKFNDKDITVKIGKIGIAPEGFSSIYTLSKEERKKDLLLIDIGGRTINVLEFYENKAQKKETLGYGIVKLYQALKDAHGEDDYTLEEMRRIVNGGFLKKDVVDSHKKQFVQDLSNDLKVNFKAKVFNVVFTGGGSSVLEEELKDAFPKSYVLEDNLFSNVKGNLNIAKALWKEN